MTKEQTMKETRKEQMSWYAVRTMNNKEKSVLEKLHHEIQSNRLEDKIGKSIIPTEKLPQIKNGKKTFRDKVVYPGYIFIETNAIGEMNNILKTINGSAGFVRTRSGEILPMKPSEIRDILSNQEESDNKDTGTMFVVNEEIKVIDGPFSSFKGKILSIDESKSKVKVEVSIFGRPTNVELEFIQIQKV